jgi:hypothetical protein
MIEILSSFISNNESELAELAVSNLSSEQVCEIKNACRRLSLIGNKFLDLLVHFFGIQIYVSQVQRQWR